MTRLSSPPRVRNRLTTDRKFPSVRQTLNAVVVQRIEVSPGLAILRVAPNGWELGNFTPGQFAVLGLPESAPRCPLSDEEPSSKSDRMIKRAYSIASSSVSREFLELYVALVPSGRLTPRLFALVPGDRLWLGHKFSGLFTLDQVPDDQHLVLLSTGTGLAPYMSMLRTQLTCGGVRRFAVLHGARHSWDLGYRSELTTLARMCPNFDYAPCISRPDEEIIPWSGQTGYIQDLWMRKPLEHLWNGSPSPENSHVFICGNPGMVESMVELLGHDRFCEHTQQQPGQIHEQPGQIHVERYW